MREHNVLKLRRMNIDSLVSTLIPRCLHVVHLPDRNRVKNVIFYSTFCFVCCSIVFIKLFGFSFCVFWPRQVYPRLVVFVQHFYYCILVTFKFVEKFASL